MPISRRYFKITVGDMYYAEVKYFRVYVVGCVFFQLGWLSPRPLDPLPRLSIRSEGSML